jgi:hypothetical protein
MSEPSESEFQALEQALIQLKPAAATLPRDRLLYEAGQISLAGKLRLWRWLSGALGVLALGLLIGLICQRSAEPRIRYVEVPRPVEPADKLPLEEPNPPAAVLMEPSDVPAENTLPRNSVWYMHQQILRTGEVPMPVPEPEPMQAEPAAPIPTVWGWQTSKAFGSLVKE